MNELISVIVPVYNVEDYLDECMESLINQTYRNLEIILVDDGSTDSSGKKCDTYANCYSNIYAFHKPNGGLSDARNYGMNKAQGALISFVDSDDCLDNRFISVLYKLITKYNKKMSCIRYDLIGEKVDYSLPKATGKIEVLSASEYIETIILGFDCKKRFASYGVQFRLYRRELLKGLEFPKGKIYEDIVYSTQAIIKAGECVYYNKPLYHYRIRMGSLSNNLNYDVRLLTDKLFNERQQIKLMQNNGMHNLSRLVKVRMKDDLIRQIRNYPKNPYTRRIKSEIDSIKIDYWSLLFSDFTIKRKLFFFRLFVLWNIGYYKKLM